MLSADYRITPPSGMSLTGDDLQNILGTVQANGGVKELDFSVRVSSFDEDYQDFDIPILISSIDGLYEWNDLLRLRFFRETMSIHVRSESNEVLGVVLSPDTQAFPFQTRGRSGSITLPARLSGYILALSGADYNTETKYALRINEPPDGDGSSLSTASINEPNNDEIQTTQLVIGDDCLGFLGVYDLDFYSIFNVESFVLPELTGETPTTDKTPTWNWSVPIDSVDEYRFKIDDNTEWTYTSDNSYTPISDLDYGTHTIYLQSKDRNGNWSADASFSIIIEPQIGEEYQGGIVFYTDGLGGGFIAQETAIHSVWWSGYVYIFYTDSGIGTGLENTNIIVNSIGLQNEDYPSYAAKICYELDNSGYNDWFLPSVDELNLIYVNLQTSGLHDYGDHRFWASEISGRYEAKIQIFGSGVQLSRSRMEIASFIPVRTFEN